jgi:hypothetical protein
MPEHKTNESIDTLKATQQQSDQTHQTNQLN